MKFGLKTKQIAWPSNDQVVREALRTANIVKAMYLSENDLFSLLDLHPLAKPLYTTLIDLESSLDELMRQMDPKSCRYEIRKSDKMDFNHHVNEFHDEAFGLFNHFIVSNGYRAAITQEEWKGYASITDLHTIWHDNTLIAAHLILLNPPKRARLLLSATADRKDESLRNFISPLNRRLHWCEIIWYKEKGYLEYDFGGILNNPDDPRYSITRFKNSFGGKPITEYSLYLFGNKPVSLVIDLIARSIVGCGMSEKLLHSWSPGSLLAGNTKDPCPP